MTIEQFKMLKCVAEEGTLKSASEKLFKSQAALSKGIKQLESQLALQLFDRNGYRMVLTPEGQRILQLALMLLEKADEIENLSQHLSAGNEASVTLSFCTTFDLRTALPILEDIQNQFPDTQIIIKQENISGAIEALHNELADLSISYGFDAQLNHPNLDNQHVNEGILANVAAPKLIDRHPNLCSVKALLKEYQIVLKDSGSGTQGTTWGVQDGQRCWYVNDLSTKKMLILSGMGWGTMPMYLIEQEAQNGAVQRLNLDDTHGDHQMNFYVYKPRNKILGPVASELWRQLGALSELDDARG